MGWEVSDNTNDITTFPSADSMKWIPKHPDMSKEQLCDHFAGLAMQGMLAGLSSNETMWADESPLQVATWAYMHADAMLAAREKKP